MVESLLPKSGSGVGEVTVAVLIILSVASKLTVPRIRTVMALSTARVPKSRLPVHGSKVVPPSIEYSGSIRVSGIVSLKTTFSALEGPKLFTLISYCNKVPGTAELESAVLITKRSADGLTSVSVVDVLLSRFGSSVVEETTAVFMRISVADESTIPLMMMALTSPTVNVPKLRLSVHGSKVIPPSTEYSGFKIVSGKVSVKVTFSAGNGPLLMTSIV